MSDERNEGGVGIRSIGIRGAGQMGGGIAQVAAQAGYEVKLADASREMAEKGRGKIQAILQKQVDKGKVSVDMLGAILSRIEAVDSVAGFRDCDLVVEAATENTDLKL